MEDEAAVDEDIAVDPDDSPTTTDVLDNPRWVNVVTGPTPRDEEPVSGGGIVVALESEPNSLMPSEFRAAGGTFNVLFAIYDPLVTRDADGQLRPYLAESVEANDDSTEWTVTLRSGVQFHDGADLDASALARNFEEHLRAEGTDTEVALRSVQRMDVIDDRTVRYVMNQPDTEFPNLLELPAGWPFSPTAAEELGDGFGDQPVGTGPFQFVSWQRDGDLVLERNPDYWQGGQPYLDGITFRPVADERSRLAALESGDVDAVHGAGLSTFAADVADIEGVTVALGPGNRATGVNFNTAEPPTDDVRVRQALAHAVDREALLAVAAGEAAELTEARTQLFPEASPLYSERVADAWPDHAPERARELVDEYVDDANRSDGREPGEPVALALNSSNLPANVELAMAYAGFYEEVGFDVTVQPMEQAALVSGLLSGDFEAQLTPGIGDNRSLLGEVQFYLGDTDEVRTNFTNFHDDTIAQIMTQLRVVDAEGQSMLAEELGLHLADQVPFDWLGGTLDLIAAQDPVRGARSWKFPDGSLGDGTRPGITFWGQVWLDSP